MTSESPNPAAKALVEKLWTNEPDENGFVQVHVSALEEAADFILSQQAECRTLRNAGVDLLDRLEAAERKIADLEAAVRGLLRAEYESAGHGLLDCVDNGGEHYQSQFLADQIKRAETLLSGAPE